MAGGRTNRSIIAASQTAPDRFYTWRVRLSSLKESVHISTSDGSDVNNIAPCFARTCARVGHLARPLMASSAPHERGLRTDYHKFTKKTSPILPDGSLHHPHVWFGRPC